MKKVTTKKQVLVLHRASAHWERLTNLKLKEIFVVRLITAKLRNAKAVSQWQSVKFKRAWRPKDDVCKVDGTRKKKVEGKVPHKELHNNILKAPSMWTFIPKKASQQEHRCTDVNTLNNINVAQAPDTPLGYQVWRRSAWYYYSTDVELFLILTNIVYSELMWAFIYSLLCRHSLLVGTRRMLNLV